MKIKKNDLVLIITGKDKGTKGKVLKAFPREDRVLVEGVQIRKVHKKANKQGGKGQIIEKAYPIHVSNVRLAEKKAKK